MAVRQHKVVGLAILLTQHQIKVLRAALLHQALTDGVVAAAAVLVP